MRALAILALIILPGCLANTSEGNGGIQNNLFPTEGGCLIQRASSACDGVTSVEGTPTPVAVYCRGNYLRETAGDAFNARLLGDQACMCTVLGTCSPIPDQCHTIVWCVDHAGDAG